MLTVKPSLNGRGPEILRETREQDKRRTAQMAILVDQDDPGRSSSDHSTRQASASPAAGPSRGRTGPGMRSHQSSDRGRSSNLLDATALAKRAAARGQSRSASPLVSAATGPPARSRGTGAGGQESTNSPLKPAVLPIAPGCDRNESATEGSPLSSTAMEAAVPLSPQAGSAGESKDPSGRSAREPSPTAHCSPLSFEDDPDAHLSQENLPPEGSPSHPGTSGSNPNASSLEDDLLQEQIIHMLALGPMMRRNIIQQLSFFSPKSSPLAHDKLSTNTQANENTGANVNDQRKSEGESSGTPVPEPRILHALAKVAHAPTNIQPAPETDTTFPERRRHGGPVNRRLPSLAVSSRSTRPGQGPSAVWDLLPEVRLYRVRLDWPTWDERQRKSVAWAIDDQCHRSLRLGSQEWNDVLRRVWPEKQPSDAEREEYRRHLQSQGEGHVSNKDHEQEYSDLVAESATDNAASTPQPEGRQGEENRDSDVDMDLDNDDTNDAMLAHPPQSAPAPAHTRTRDMLAEKTDRPVPSPSSREPEDESERDEAQDRSSTTHVRSHSHATPKASNSGSPKRHHRPEADYPRKRARDSAEADFVGVGEQGAGARQSGASAEDTLAARRRRESATTSRRSKDEDLAASMHGSPSTQPGEGKRPSSSEYTPPEHGSKRLPSNKDTTSRSRAARPSSSAKEYASEGTSKRVFAAKENQTTLHDEISAEGSTSGHLPGSGGAGKEKKPLSQARKLKQTEKEKVKEREKEKKHLSSRDLPSFPRTRRSIDYTDSSESEAATPVPRSHPRSTSATSAKEVAGSRLRHLVQQYDTIASEYKTRSQDLSRLRARLEHTEHQLVAQSRSSPSGSGSGPGSRSGSRSGRSAAGHPPRGEEPGPESEGAVVKASVLAEADTLVAEQQRRLDRLARIQAQIDALSAIEE